MNKCNLSGKLIVFFKIERNRLLKEQQAREEAVKQKEELEKKVLEYQEDAKRTREALVSEKNSPVFLEILVRGKFI